MIEDKLLHNVNICRGLIQIVHMVKVNLKSTLSILCNKVRVTLTHLAGLVRYPPGPALVPQVVAPAPASVNWPVWVDQQRVAPGARNEDDAPGVRGGVEGSHGVRADVVVPGQAGPLLHHVGHQGPVGLLVLAAAEAEAEPLEAGVWPQPRLLQTLKHHVTDPLICLIKSNLEIHLLHELTLSHTDSTW